MAKSKSSRGKKSKRAGISKSPGRSKASAKATHESAEAVPAVMGSEAEFLRFLPEAQKLVRVTPFRADASLAYHNVEAGVTALLSQRTLLDARVRDVDWASLSSLPRLALAVCFAASEAQTAAPAASELPKLLARGRALRKLLLDAASALATAGLLSPARVDAIRAGHGSLDAARDCVDLAALFRANAKKLRGKHAVTPEQIAAAATTGTALLKVLKPAKKEKAPELAAAQDARDRLWTLLVERHVEVRRLGMFVWVEDVDAHVPTLQAHRGGGQKKKPTHPELPAAPTNGVATATT